LVGNLNQAIVLHIGLYGYDEWFVGGNITLRRNEIMIDLDRMTNDPNYEHYAYRKREPVTTTISTISIPVWMILVGLVGMVVAFIFIMSLTNIHH
jgi:hypothetical protein